MFVDERSPRRRRRGNVRRMMRGDRTTARDESFDENTRRVLTFFARAVHARAVRTRARVTVVVAVDGEARRAILKAPGRVRVRAFGGDVLSRGVVDDGTVGGGARGASRSLRDAMRDVRE